LEPVPARPVIRFGPFVLDQDAGELRKGGSRIRLQEKSLRVLVALIEQQNQVVTREELRKRLWPDDTFVDFETGLNTAVSKLRDALSDVAEKPRYIETIPRRGYRFIPSAEFISPQRIDSQTEALTTGSPSAEPSQATVPGHPARTSRRATDRFWRRASPFAAAVAIAFAFWWLAPLPDPRVTNIFPVTTNGRQDFLVRPATDGVHVFYVQRDGDHYDLMQVSTRGGQPQQITAPFPNSLIWDVSADGTQYLLTSFEHRGEPAPLWTWSATGGPPVRIGDLVSGSATWSPDGKRIAYHAGHDLLIANSDGSAQHRLATFAEEPDSPVWSPDGSTIRFNLNNPVTNSGQIWEVRPDGSKLRNLLPHWTGSPRVCCGTWTPDARYFLFVDSDEKSSLWAIREKGDWLRRSPRGPFLLASEAMGSWSPLVGRDGKHVYFYGNGSQGELELFSASARKFTPFLPEAHLAVWPSFSPDGSSIIYSDFATGVLWRARADASSPRQLTGSGLSVSFPRWSPDGKIIAFAGHLHDEETNTFIIAAGGSDPQILASGTHGLRDPDWSPDGTGLAVTRPLPGSSSASDTELALVDWKTRRIRALPNSVHLYGARWCPAGRLLAAIDDQSGDLVLYDMQSQQWRSIAHGKFVGLPVWSPDGAYLYFQDLLEPGEPLRRFQLSAGTFETVVNFQDVLRTGVHRCVFTSIAPSGDPIIQFDRGDADIYGANLVLP
jgi:Tol biopolymer transport system component/DNA-binding winged helix-turn-helix (wHTH) protein